MKKRNYLALLMLVLAVAFSMTGCHKGGDDGGGDDGGDGDKSSFLDLNIDPGFKFEMTKDIPVVLSINSDNPKEPQQKFYIYNGDPEQGGKLLSSGMTTPYLVFQETIKVPSYLDELWVVRKDVYGGVDTRSFDITSGTLHYSYQLNSKSVKFTKTLDLHPDPGCGNECTPISGVYNNLVIEDDYCVPAGQALTVINLKFEGGTLVVCGMANLTTVSVQGAKGGKLIISSSGNANITNLQTSHLDYFVNYGVTNLMSNVVIAPGCKFENENVLRLGTGGFTNKSDHFYNVGVIQGSGGGPSVNEGKIFNDHIMMIAGNFVNNSGAEIINNCHISISSLFTQDGYLENNAYVAIGVDAHLNGGSTNVFGPQALMKVGVALFIDGPVQGPSVSSAKIDILGVCTVNGSGSVTANMDLCAVGGIVNNGQIDNSVTFCDCYIPTNECNPGSGDPGDGGGDDSDKDGCPDNVDEYPNDPERCSNDYYPSEDEFATLAFEDLWNATGDYDFNDLVVEFNYKTVKNAQNKVVEIFAKFHVAALGADLNNGFGLEFSTPTNTIDTVTGNVILGNAVTIGPNGAEEGPLNKAVVIIYDALNDYAGTSMVNTVPGGNAKDFDTIDVYIKFNHSVADMDPAPFNPFMFIDQERGKETHLIDFPPTEMVNPIYFGENADDSDPATGRYYVTETNLPWVIEIPQIFDWPKEQADILTAYHKFQEWAESSGQLYPDWYKDLPGYREPANIYKTAQP
jgi:LruC domain-containing protein